MAISDSLDSIGGAASTTTTSTDSDLNFSLRKRSGAAAVRATSDSNAAELDNTTNVDAAAVEGPMHSANFATTNGENHRGHDIRFTCRPSVPAHRRIKESPLSSDAIFKQQSHAGLFNLCIVVLVAVNSRLIIENLMKYGWLIRTGFWFSSKSLSDWPLFMCCLTLPVFPFAAFIVEKLAQQKCLSEPVDDVSAYPNVDCSYDVSFKSLAYFMVAPTLCYQPCYPRTASIRKGWVVRQSIKLIIFTGVMGFIIEQYINPIVQNSQHPLKGNFLYAIERVLKLSIPILYVWLCMFYCFFHLWLNILAELLRFGDREFYKDWWNAKTVEEYWRMWNMPVHKWMVRHIYFPSIRHGIPKGVAIVIAFLVSAVFHELCIAVPCHIFKLWAFVGIMFQVPLVLITNFLQARFGNTMVGNMIFWFIFCIFGQPMCVLLYYHDLMNRGEN